MSNPTTSSGRGASDVAAIDSTAIRKTDSVEQIARELLAQLDDLGLDARALSTARAQAPDLAAGRNVETFAPHLAGVLDSGNELARGYAARLRRALGIAAAPVVPTPQAAPASAAVEHVPDAAVGDVRVSDETPIARLKLVAEKVVQRIKSLGLRGQGLAGAERRACAIRDGTDATAQLRAARELADSLRKGNADAQEFADAIVDELQLKLPIVTDPPAAEPAARSAAEQHDAAPTGDEQTVQPPETPHHAVDLASIDELQSAEPFASLFPIKPGTLAAIVADIKANGYDAAQPLVVWRTRRVVVDGHTRLQAARQAELPHVPVVYREFADDDAAIRYAIHSQRDRRNLADADILRLVGELDKRRQRGGDRRSDEARSKTSREVSDRSSKTTAELLGTSQAKVEAVRAVIGSADSSIQEAVAAGATSIRRGAAQARAAKRAPITADEACQHARTKAAGCLAEAERLLRPSDAALADAIARNRDAVLKLVARTKAETAPTAKAPGKRRTAGGRASA